MLVGFLLCTHMAVSENRLIVNGPIQLDIWQAYLIFSQTSKSYNNDDQTYNDKHNENYNQNHHNEKTCHNDDNAFMVVLLMIAIMHS